jgi:hypothetical protein
MGFLLAIFFIIGTIIQIGNIIYWILTKLHLTAAYRQDTNTIVSDLGYTMDQYFNDSYIRYLVTQEWIQRIKR